MVYSVEKLIKLMLLAEMLPEGHHDRDHYVELVSEDLEGPWWLGDRQVDPQAAVALIRLGLVRDTADENELLRRYRLTSL
jgi:hypothetical protein